MKTNKNPTLGAIAAAVIVSVTGCTTVVPVKDVLNNKSDYVAKNFSLSNIQPAVAKQIPDNLRKINFKNLVVKQDANSEDSDGKKDSWTSTVTMEPISGELINLTREHSSNGIPYNITYAISYRGIMDLRWQFIPLQSQLTSDIYEVKETTQISKLSAEGSEFFSSKYSSAPSVQIANYQPYTRTCKPTKTTTASEYNKNFTGQATELECQNFKGNALHYRSKWIFLHDLGVTIMLENISTTSKSFYKITDVTIRM